LTSLELLAPAKDLECGIAAIDHGADAVYIGASRYGARAAAGNSVDDIRKLCEYAHPFGVKVYVTLNTILYDDEIKDVSQLLSELDNTGVDAILVQDMAFLSMFGRTHSMSLHASTQMDNRTAEKVSWLKKHGFSRAVLARELSVDEISEIHSKVPDMELEVFVHGALCVSFSGLCYASQHCFHRSANRGECAQFCRMRFSLFDDNGQEIEHERYLLSLKDLNQSEHLLQLVEAGATSFKIEGRLKDATYVKNVTAAYNERLNDIVRRFPDRYRRASLGHCEYTFVPDLNRTFNRSYTTYFLNGRQHGISSFDTPKAVGEFVGTVKELRRDSFNVAGTAHFTNGDGLCFLSADGRQFEGFRANRVNGNRIFPLKMPEGLKPGTRLYRSNDQEFERLLSKPSARRKIPISLSLSATMDGFSLTASINGQDITLDIQSEHQNAAKPPHENIVRQLTRLGDSRYQCDDVDISADFSFFIPNSVLSDMRRRMVALLEQRMFSTKDRTPSEIKYTEDSKHEGNSYTYPYFYNISNALSRQFYGAKSMTAYELKGGNGPIMQCRYCIRYALGYCVKKGGKQPLWKEPLYLKLGDGRRFRLEFDCKNCQMNIYA